jgi:hypothetical protein
MAIGGTIGDNGGVTFTTAFTKQQGAILSSRLGTGEPRVPA